MSEPIIFTAVSEALAGVFGGLFSSLLTYPWELAKNRYQLQVEEQTAEKYSGTLHAISSIYKAEGVKGSFRGFEGEVTKECVKNFCSFYFYELFKNLARARKARNRKNQTQPQVADSTSNSNSLQETPIDDLDIITNLFVGICSSIVTVAIMNPLQVATFRIQMRSNTAPDANLGAVKTILYILRSKGLKNLYKGIFPALTLTLNPALQFMVFDQIKKLFLARKRLQHAKKRRRVRVNGEVNGVVNNEVVSLEYEHELTQQIQLNGFETFAIGAIAKAASTIITFPLILAKMKLQLVGDSPTHTQSASTLEVLKYTFASEGLSGLYRGMHSQLGKAVLASGIIFASKEYISIYTARLMGSINKMKQS